MPKLLLIALVCALFSFAAISIISYLLMGSIFTRKLIRKPDVSENILDRVMPLIGRKAIREGIVQMSLLFGLMSLWIPYSSDPDFSILNIYHYHHLPLLVGTVGSLMLIVFLCTFGAFELENRNNIKMRDELIMKIQNDSLELLHSHFIDSPGWAFLAPYRRAFLTNRSKKLTVYLREGKNGMAGYVILLKKKSFLSVRVNVFITESELAELKATYQKKIS